ncbi:MAG: twin-arginine translocase TatA/TatE family subunit [Nitrospirae bacterium]|nr:twin-arginine translocase TatA/TatE family subunit [Nitrospirota bacterium]
MFDLGIQEIIMIFFVALLVFGPKSLPDLAKKVGKILGQIKRVMADVRSHVDSTMYADNNPLKDELNSIQREIHDVRIKADAPSAMTQEHNTSELREKADPSHDRVEQTDLQKPAQKEESSKLDGK